MSTEIAESLLNDCVHESRNVIADSINAQTVNDFNRIISTSLCDLIPHKAAARGTCDIISRQVHSYANIDYPRDICCKSECCSASVYSP